MIKLLIKLRQFQKIHNRIIQKVTNVHDKEIPKKIPEEKYIYIYPEERQKIIINLRLIW